MPSSATRLEMSTNHAGRRWYSSELVEINEGSKPWRLRLGPVEFDRAQLDGAWFGDAETVPPLNDRPVLGTVVVVGLALTLAMLGGLLGTVVALVGGLWVLNLMWLPTGNTGLPTKPALPSQMDWRSRLDEANGKVTLMIAHKPVRPRTSFLTSYAGVPVARVPLANAARLSMPVTAAPKRVSELVPKGQRGLVTITGLSREQAEELVWGVVEALKPSG